MLWDWTWPDWIHRWNPSELPIRIGAIVDRCSNVSKRNTHPSIQLSTCHHRIVLPKSDLNSDRSDPTQSESSTQLSTRMDPELIRDPIRIQAWALDFHSSESYRWVNFPSSLSKAKRIFKHHPLESLSQLPNSDEPKRLVKLISQHLIGYLTQLQWMTESIWIVESISEIQSSLDQIQLINSTSSLNSTSITHSIRIEISLLIRDQIIHSSSQSSFEAEYYRWAWGSDSISLGSDSKHCARKR